MRGIQKEEVKDFRSFYLFFLGGGMCDAQVHPGIASLNWTMTIS